MPNWVKNIVRFHGKKDSIEKLKKFIVVDNEYKKQLKERNASLTEDFRIEIPKKGEISFNILIPQPTNIFQGSAGKKEEEKYGKNTWYDWNIEHWGTKWDACEYKVYQTKRCLELSFWTAWSCPEPWYKAICEKAVEIGGFDSIDGEFADEDFGGFMAYTHYDFDENEFVIAGSDYDRELYELVWGEGTCEFYEEELGAYEAAMEMAGWKEQQMIKKAVDWLNNNIGAYLDYEAPKYECSVEIDKVSLIEDFKQAMEK